MKTMTTIPSAGDEIKTPESSPTDIFTTLGPDFTITHIITRLDILTLIAFGCTSRQLGRLSIEVDLFWQTVCTLIWPSLLDPIVVDVISAFPGGYRSFFYDAFPSIHHNTLIPPPSNPPEELISAVDLYCQQGPAIFSKVERLNNRPWEWEGYNMNIFYGVKVNANVLVPMDDLPLVEEKCEKWLKENMRLSWIVIDPSQKRAANLSSCKPLWVQQNLSISDDDFDFNVVFGVMMMAAEEEEEKKVKCRVKVRCRLSPGGEEKNVLCIRKVSMEMKDMDLWPVMWRNEIFSILQTAMLNGERKIFHTNKRRPKGEDEEEEEASMIQFNYYDHVSIARTIGLQIPTNVIMPGNWINRILPIMKKYINGGSLYTGYSDPHSHVGKS